jgi:DNA-directed RNA polymerase specialized sigma24 family protein
VSASFRDSMASGSRRYVRLDALVAGEDQRRMEQSEASADAAVLDHHQADDMMETELARQLAALASRHPETVQLKVLEGLSLGQAAQRLGVGR